MKMIKALPFILLFMISAGSGKSQPKVQFNYPETHEIERDELWNFSISIPGYNQAEANLNMVIKEPVGGEILYTSRQEHVTNLSMIPGNIFRNANKAFSFTGPCQVCISSEPVTGNSSEGIIGESCTDVIVKPGMPPALISPVHMDTIFTTRPQYSWQLPPGIAYNPVLGITLEVVRVVSGTQLQPFERNPLVFKKEGLDGLRYEHASDQAPLPGDGLYAWRILINAKKKVIKQSENGFFFISTGEHHQEDPKGD